MATEMCKTKAEGQQCDCENDHELGASRDALKVAPEVLAALWAEFRQNLTAFEIADRGGDAHIPNP